MVLAVVTCRAMEGFYVCMRLSYVAARGNAAHTEPRSEQFFNVSAHRGPSSFDVASVRPLSRKTLKHSVCMHDSFITNRGYA